MSLSWTRPRAVNPVSSDMPTPFPSHFVTQPAMQAKIQLFMPLVVSFPSEMLWEWLWFLWLTGMMATWAGHSAGLWEPRMRDRAPVACCCLPPCSPLPPLPAPGTARFSREEARRLRGACADTEAGPRRSEQQPSVHSAGCSTTGEKWEILRAIEHNEFSQWINTESFRMGISEALIQWTHLQCSMALKIPPFTCGTATAASGFSAAVFNARLCAGCTGSPAETHSGTPSVHQLACWPAMKENSYPNRKVAPSFKSPDAFWLLPAAK